MKIKASSLVSSISLAFSVAYLTGFILLLVGWCLNVYHVILFANSTAPITFKVIFECVGILVAPIGAILGLFL